MKKILVLSVSIFALIACTPDEDTVFPQSVPGKTVFAKSLDDAQKNRASLLKKYNAELSYEFGKNGDNKGEVKETDVSKDATTTSSSNPTEVKPDVSKSMSGTGNKKDTNSVKFAEEDKLWKNAVQYLAKYPIETISDSSKLISSEWFDLGETSKKINIIIRGEIVEVSVFVRNKEVDGSWSKTFKNSKEEEKIKNIILGKQSK